MNKITLIFFCITSYSYLTAQNVGIGETNPTHTLHVSPFNLGDDPIRVNGLNLSNPSTDTSFVMFNNGDGVFKYIPFNNVINLIADSLSSSTTFVDLISDALLPAGEVHTFSTETPPNGYLECNGQAVNRTTYSRLFTAIGTMYGSGDGTTTFNVPDYRGQFLRGFDNSSGIDLDATNRTDRGDGTSGDAIGTKQNNQTLAHNHTIDPPSTVSTSTGDHSHSIDPPSTNTNTTGNHLHTINPPVTNSNSTGTHTHSVNPPNTTTTTNGAHSHNLKTSTGTPGNDIVIADNNGTWWRQSTPNAVPWSGSPAASTYSAGAHNHSINIAAFNSASAGNHSHSIDIAQFNSNTTGDHSHAIDIAQFNSASTGNHTHLTDIGQFSSGNQGGTETRPTNISVLWCIKF